MQEYILKAINSYKQIFDEEYYKLFKGNDATNLLYEGYCFYFAKLLYDTFDNAVICKNPMGDHYFIKLDDNYYDARANFNSLGMLSPINKNEQGQIEDLDGTFIKPIEILDVNEEEKYANQVGGVKDSIKDNIWAKIAPVLYTESDKLKEEFNNAHKR